MGIGEFWAHFSHCSQSVYNYRQMYMICQHLIFICDVYFASFLIFCERNLHFETIYAFCIRIFVYSKSRENKKELPQERQFLGFMES